MEKTLPTISHVSLLFFVLFGGLHLSSTFLIAQGVTNSVNQILFHTLDLPFLLATLSYGSSKIALAWEDMGGNPKHAFSFSLLVSLVIFSGALFLNFTYPDALSFPS